MSGGSYNYLYSRLGDGTDPEVLRMLERLRELRYVTAAEELSGYVLPTPSEELVELLRAVEWYDSSDYVLEQADAANRAYIASRAAAPRG